MLRVDGNIHVDYPAEKPRWRVTIAHDGGFPLAKGQRVLARVLTARPALDENAFGLRPLWLFLEADPQRYEVEISKDGSCKISYTWPIKA